MLALATGFAMATAGISKSIERVCKVMMPLFYVMFIYMAVRVAMMPGASEGYKYLFILPDAKHLLNPETWIFCARTGLLLALARGQRDDSLRLVPR